MHWGNDLAGHVSGLVISILLPVPGALQEAGQLARRVIGIGAGGGCAVVLAHLARDVAVLVVAVPRRALARAAGGLREQIAIFIAALQLTPCQFEGSY